MELISIASIWLDGIIRPAEVSKLIPIPDPYICKLLPLIVSALPILFEILTDPLISRAAKAFNFPIPIFPPEGCRKIPDDSIIAAVVGLRIILSEVTDKPEENPV